VICARGAGEEDSRVTQIGAHLHLGHDDLTQAGILDLAKEKPAEFAPDQIFDPVGTSIR
jgi:hypothetical protein